jgi:hypothetical protein
MKSLHMQSFWQHKGPTDTGIPHTKPALHRVSAELVASRASPMQSASLSHALVQVGPVGGLICDLLGD